MLPEWLLQRLPALPRLPTDREDGQSGVLRVTSSRGTAAVREAGGSVRRARPTYPFHCPAFDEHGRAAQARRKRRPSPQHRLCACAPVRLRAAAPKTRGQPTRTRVRQQSRRYSPRSGSLVWVHLPQNVCPNRKWRPSREQAESGTKISVNSKMPFQPLKFWD